MSIYIIGSGGVGSWLVPSLAMLLGEKRRELVLVDGDKLERKNLNRQLFDELDIGRPKAEALGERYGIEAMCEWFSYGVKPYASNDVLLVAVDNHIARHDALRTADTEGCLVIIGANETFSAEAYVYRPEWKNTSLDPRIYYPEIVKDTSNDPRQGTIGCTGEEQVKNPQLVTANFMAAALMQHLFIVWVMEFRKFDRAAQEHLPHKLVSNLTKLSSIKTGAPAPRTERT